MTEQSHNHDSLIDRERIRGASRMIPEGTEATDVTDEQITRVGADVELALRNWKISRKEIARSIGRSPSVISEFCSGKYAGNRGQVALDLEKWFVEEEIRRQRPQTTQFVWTNVAMQIKSVASYCLDYRKIGLVYGPDTAGVGKTTALRAIHQDLGPRRSTLVTLDRVDGNPTGLLKRILQSMHLDDHGSNLQRFNRIAQHLAGRSHLLMVDQVHALRGSAGDKPLFLLADLFDRTETAQLWCGTADMLAYLERERARTADESLAQIRRRIYPCVDLMEGVGVDGDGGVMLADVDQVREMFARNRLKLTGASARFLCQLLNTPDSGGVGVCVQIVEYSTMLAEGRKLGMIDVPLLREALQRGLTAERARVILSRVEEPRQRAAAVA